MGQKAHDRDTLEESERALKEKQIQRELVVIRTTIPDEITALAHIQAATAEDIKAHPLFYRAIWELMKERRWDKRTPKKKEEKR